MEEKKPKILILSRNGRLGNLRDSLSGETDCYSYDSNSEFERSNRPPPIGMDMDLVVRHWNACDENNNISDEHFSKIVDDAHWPFIIVGNAFTFSFNLNKRKSEYYRGTIWEYHKNSAHSDNIPNTIREVLKEKAAIQKHFRYVCLLFIRDGKIYLKRKRDILTLPGNFCGEKNEKTFLQEIEKSAKIRDLYETFTNKTPWGDYTCRVYFGQKNDYCREDDFYLPKDILKPIAGVPQLTRNIVELLKKQLLV